MPDLLTVGHGTLDRAGLAQLLQAAQIDLVVDVRRYPNSRRNPDVRHEALQSWLPEVGIDYRWEERLGGRRHLKAGTESPDTWWTVAAFRAYAAYTRSEKFSAGLAELLDAARQQPVAILCSETLWWRCHRRLIADVATLAYELPIAHLMPSGRFEPHRPAPGARLSSDHQLVWDGSSD